MPAKPKLFVGSSTEGKIAVQALQQILGNEVTVVPWFEADEFKNGSFSTLDLLMTAVDKYDFAAFLLTPDDAITSRGKSTKGPRDNVIFEFGLFLGWLGQERTFAFLQERQTHSEEPYKVPSDLAGINIQRFNMSADRDELRSSLRGAADVILNGITNTPNWWSLDLDLIRSWGIALKTEDFHVTLGEAALNRHRSKFVGKSFVVVIRKSDRSIPAETDKRISVSKPRLYSALDRDIEISVKSKTIIGGAHEGDVIEGHVFSIHSSSKTTKFGTMTELIDAGGRLLKSVGKTVPHR
jgi:hypothetical protein